MYTANQFKAIALKMLKNQKENNDTLLLISLKIIVMANAMTYTMASEK